MYTPTTIAKSAPTGSYVKPMIARKTQQHGPSPQVFSPLGATSLQRNRNVPRESWPTLSHPKLAQGADTHGSTLIPGCLRLEENEEIFASTDLSRPRNGIGQMRTVCRR